MYVLQCARLRRRLWGVGAPVGWGYVVTIKDSAGLLRSVWNKKSHKRDSIGRSW